MKTPVKVTITSQFTTWVVTFQEKTMGNVEFIPLRQKDWSLNVDSTQAQQYATIPPPPSDKEVTSMPVLEEPYANDELDNKKHPENLSFSPVGTATVTIIKP